MSKPFFSLNFDPIKNSSRGYTRMVNANISTRGNKFWISFEGGKKFAQSWWHISELHHTTMP